MQPLLKVVDEHFGVGADGRLPAFELRLASERITARELIERRIADEVAAVNQRNIAAAAGHARSRSFLIALDEDGPEARLNEAPRPRRPRLVDQEAERARAICAFEKRQFILLFDDRQIEDLDEAITLSPESEAVFLYLTPLVGG